MSDVENTCDGPRMKVLKNLDKMESAERFDSIDSGFESLTSNPSDRSNADSYSIEDPASCKECNVSQELTNKTALLNINKTEKSVPTDEGYNSMSTLEKDDASQGEAGLSSDSKRQHTSFISGCQNSFALKCMQYFAVTQDIRYALTPLWPMLLQQNNDGDTYVFLRNVSVKF